MKIEYKILIFLMLTLFKLWSAMYFLKQNKTKMASLEFFCTGTYFTMLVYDIFEFFKEF